MYRTTQLTPYALLFALLLLAAPCWAADGPLPDRDSLARMLDPTQDTSRKVLAAYDSKGLPAALEVYRTARAAQDKIPLWRVEPSSRTPDQLRRKADAVMARGFISSGHPDFSLKLPIDWAADPYHDRSWRFWLNSLDPIDDLLAAYYVTNDPKYLHFAQAVTVDWLMQHPQSISPNPFAWYDMAVGLRASKLAYLLDASARDPATKPETLALLLYGAWKHGQQLAREETFNYRTNHGIFQAKGLLELGLAMPELADAKTWQQLGQRRLSMMFTRWFSAEGVHLEHSPGYHLAMTDLLQDLVASGLLSDPALAELNTKAQQALAWMIAPDGTLPQIGDTGTSQAALPSLHVPEAPLAPALLYTATKGQEGTAPSASFQAFPAAGLAVFRSAWPKSPDDWAQASYLAFSAAFHSRTHKHADDLTFVWYDAGRWLIVDAGRYGYYYDEPGRKYCESSRAHNVVEIDNADYSRLPSDAFGSALRSCGQQGDISYAIAAIKRNKPALGQLRALIFQPGQWLVVWDELLAPATHSYTQWFHFAPDLEVKGEGKRAVLDLGQGRSLYVVPLAKGAPHQLTLVKGEQGPPLQGWYSPSHRTLSLNWALGQHIETNNAALITLFVLGDAPPEVGPARGSLSQGEFSLHWTQSGRPQGFNLTLRATSESSSPK